MPPAVFVLPSTDGLSLTKRLYSNHAPHRPCTYQLHSVPPSIANVRKKVMKINGNKSHEIDRARVTMEGGNGRSTEKCPL